MAAELWRGSLLNAQQLMPLVLVVTLFGGLSQQVDQGHHQQEFEEPNERSMALMNLEKHFVIDMMFQNELAMDFKVNNVELNMAKDMYVQLVARNIQDKDNFMEFNNEFNFPKSIFKDDVNGSCSLWVSCAETMVNQSYGGEAGSLPGGVCCSDDGWIGTTLGDEGMDPFDDLWRIGTFMMVIALVDAASMLAL